MSILDHYCLVEEWRTDRDCVPVVNTTEIVIYQVKIIPFTRIVPQSEIPDQLIFGIHILQEYGRRQFGTEHI
jgi:hypothetical protein